MTTTTVGYGDLVPESSTGRVIGLVLMLAGIGIIGIITANIASMFLEPAPDGEHGETVDNAEPTHERPVVVQTEARLDEIDLNLNEILQRLDDG